MEHYFSSEPTTKKIETEVSFEVDGVKFDMTAASGTFSSTKLDPGTKVLLSQTSLLPKDGNVLDLGCGWGPIGIVIATVCPAAKVHAIDINQRSIEQTRANADRGVGDVCRSPECGPASEHDYDFHRGSTGDEIPGADGGGTARTENL